MLMRVDVEFTGEGEIERRSVGVEG